MAFIKPALCGATLLAVLASAAALAQSSRVGVLQCNLSGGVGMIIAENQALDCVFKNQAGGPPSHYIGRLTNVGANIGISGPGRMVWAVVAATNQVAPGALAGDYVGAQGSVAAGPAPAARFSSAARTTPSPCSRSLYPSARGSTFRRAWAISTCNICR